MSPDEQVRYGLPQRGRRSALLRPRPVLSVLPDTLTRHTIPSEGRSLMSVTAGCEPRPQLTAALDQVEAQIEATGPGDLDRPTPCAGYEVRTLLAHLVAVLRKLTVANKGGDTTSVPDPADDLTGDAGQAFHRARVDLELVWGPDADLDENYTMAWGTMTGRELLEAYAHEFTVHSWDLARATGRGDDLDPALARAALEWFSQNVPAEGRGEGGPFAAPIAVPDDADPYTRLAAYVGRSA